MAQLFRKYLLLALLVAVVGVAQASDNESTEPKVDTLIAVDKVQVTTTRACCRIGVGRSYTYDARRIGR